MDAYSRVPVIRRGRTFCPGATRGERAEGPTDATQERTSCAGSHLVSAVVAVVQVAVVVVSAAVVAEEGTVAAKEVAAGVLEECAHSNEKGTDDENP